MKSKLFMSLLLAVTMVTTGAGLTLAAHPDIPLYTYEEIGMQFTPNFDPATPGGLVGTLPNPNAAFNMMPVYVNATGNGFPYSPKSTCGNCHNGSLVRNDTGAPIKDGAGNNITAALVSYTDMTTQAFHSELGAQEWQDDPVSSTDSSQAGKPWSQTNGMWGKW